ncbi:MAG: hypothetical protein DMF61_27060 [Blastocatellia bacterium AA13]|nr:MAG: hypothetical protein DMF61_27060 [Blastocatellia bacterium AA13]
MIYRITTQRSEATLGGRPLWNGWPFSPEYAKFEIETKYAVVRSLHPGNPWSSKQRFYNPNILQEFDKHYTRRKKA